MEWRYGEILNFTGNLEIDDVHAWVYNYPFDDSLSSFTTSNPELQAVYDLCKYTIKATSLDLLTDR
jgi:alpha-L-rhamnosidase